MTNANRLRQYLAKASFASEGDRHSALDCLREIEQAALADASSERERLAARMEEAFRDGFYAPRTYKDIVLNTAVDAWEEAKAGLLRA